MLFRLGLSTRRPCCLQYQRSQRRALSRLKRSNSPFAWFSLSHSSFVTGTYFQVGRWLEVNQLSAYNVSFSISAQIILSTPSRCAKHLNVIRLLTDKKNDRPLSFPYKQITIQDIIFMTSTLPVFLAPGWVLYHSGRKRTCQLATVHIIAE